MITNDNVSNADNTKKNNEQSNSLFADFMGKFDKLWQKLDHDYDTMEKEIDERRKLNGKATHHEIDL